MTTLSTLQTRLRGLLMDAGSAVWDDDTLTEGLRLALGEYSLAGQQAVTIAGLDGAPATTLDPLHESLIVWGAAACCALARAVERAESFAPGSDPDALKSWGEQRLKEFKAMLGAAFPGYLAAAAGSGQADPARTAAEIALLQAQAAALTGQEARASAAAAQSAQERADEAARRADLRHAAGASWGNWPDIRSPRYPAGYERS